MSGTGEIYPAPKGAGSGAHVRLIYGLAASRRDRARYSFAHGGKDGTPFPVDRVTYDKTIEVMRDTLNGAHLDRNEKVGAFKRLASFASTPSSPPSPSPAPRSCAAPVR